VTSTIPGDTPTLAIDARALWGSGIGRYSREVIRHLAQSGRFPDLRLVGDPAELEPWCAEVGIRGQVRIVPVSGGRYSVGSQLDWPRVARTLPRGSVVWFPHWDAPLVFPSTVRTVVTVHDLIHLRVPGSASWTRRMILRCVLRVATRRARVVVTDSGFGAEDLRALEPSLADRIVTIPCGVGEQFSPAPGTTESSPLADPYLLCVANRKPHKNLTTAVEVLARLTDAAPTMRLAIAGEHFAEWHDVLSYAVRRGVADRIVDIPAVSDHELVRWYRYAECLLFPSRYEGFGMPALEAMACGTPVVASNATSLPEICGDAALLCGPDDADGMVHAILRLRTDAELRARMRTRGLQRAAEYRWSTTASLLDAAVRRAAR
jgi:glycosyltransferase involved in cell wall biosynthesis